MPELVLQAGGLPSASLPQKPPAPPEHAQRGRRHGDGRGVRRLLQQMTQPSLSLPLPPPLDLVGAATVAERSHWLGGSSTSIGLPIPISCATWTKAVAAAKLISGLRPGFWSGTDWMRPRLLNHPEEGVRLGPRPAAVEPAAHLAKEGVHHWPVLHGDPLQLVLRLGRRVGDVNQDIVVVVDKPLRRLHPSLLRLLRGDAVGGGGCVEAACVDHAAQCEPLLLRLANLVADREEGHGGLVTHVGVAPLLLLWC
eukprot:scaffold126186_cov30-Tisochrysis_lutea.AAC.1